MSMIITSPGQVREEDAELPPVRRDRSRLWRAFRRKPAGLAAAVYLALLIAVSLAAPWLMPLDPHEQDLRHVLSGPSAAHWLGTDRLGRDVLSRLMLGSQSTLLGAAEAVAVFAVLGVTLGLVAGYVGGWADRLIARLGDLLLALPGIIVLLMVLAVFPGNDLAAMIALGMLSSPHLLRIVRGVTLGVRQELYVKAARLSGLTAIQIMRRHILPRLRGPVIVQLSLATAAAVVAQAGLSFLGLASPETRGPSWGNLIGEASNVISEDGWLLVPTGGALAITVLALGLLGDAIRDATVDVTGAKPGTRRPRRKPMPVPTQFREPRHDALLSVRGLHIAFSVGGNDLTVVRDVDFDVAAGETLGIIGESGCGKTVTARSLMGLLPDNARITGGSALFDGEDLARMSDRQLARVRGSRIGLISQEPMAGLDPSFRVGSQLTEVVRRHCASSRRRARRRALELLDLVRLPDAKQVLRRYPHELSGGMAQRVAIALALAGDPELLIADEPTTALDVTVQAEILSLLSELQATLGMAVILVTHDWGVLADLCDRAVVMYAGEVVEQADLEGLYRRPLHPYTEGLLAANPHLARIGEPLPTIPGAVPAPADWPDGCHFQARCRYATDACGKARIPLVTPSLAADRVTRCLHAEEMTQR